LTRGPLASGPWPIVTVRRAFTDAQIKSEHNGGGREHDSGGLGHDGKRPAVADMPPARHPFDRSPSPAVTA
jgi:hypothetical protein